jgi:hypothetical protein
VETLASCAPLAVSLGGIAGSEPVANAALDLPTASFAGPTGTLTCPPNYASVLVRPRHDGPDGKPIIGATATVTCPTAFHLEPALPLTVYTLDLALLDATGKPIGQTTCEAFTRPGETSTPTCVPLK